MGQNEKNDRFPRYRAVLVATALIATRGAPAAVDAPSSKPDDAGWSGLAYEAKSWRTVAVRAGAIRRA